MLVWTTPVVSDKPCSVIDGGGGVNLYFYRLGTATSVLSMEDVDNWWSWSEWEGGMSQNIIYIYFKIELWHLCKSLLPSAKGLSIYFYVVSSPSQVSARTWEHYCHPHALCTANVGCIMTGSFLPWITMFNRYLNFGGALHLCFAVSKRASEIPLLSYYIMVVLTTCCRLRHLIIAR